MSPQNIVGYNLLEGLRSQHSQIERWRAVGATGPAEVFIFPRHMLATYSSLPRWGPFSKYTTQELDNNRSAMIVPGVLQADLKGVRSLLGDGVSVGFAWHISAAISVLHDTGAAHGLLHPDFVGLDNNGQLCFRPALAAGIPADPDSQASAQATDCWQLHFLFEALGVSEKVSSHLSLLLNGLSREKSIIRMAPGRSVRQALFAVCSRNKSWEEGLVKKLGDEWSLDSLPPMEQQIIPKLYPHLPRTKLAFPSSKAWDYEKTNTSLSNPSAEQFNQPSRLREAFRRNTELPSGGNRPEGTNIPENIVEKQPGIRIRLPSPSSVDNSFASEVFDEIGIDSEVSTVAQIQLPVSNRPVSNASSAGVKVSLPFNEDFAPTVNAGRESATPNFENNPQVPASAAIAQPTTPPPIRLQIQNPPPVMPAEEPSVNESAAVLVPPVQSKSPPLQIEVPEPPLSVSIPQTASVADTAAVEEHDSVEEPPQNDKVSEGFVEDEDEVPNTPKALGLSLPDEPLSTEAQSNEEELTLTLELPPEDASVDQEPNLETSDSLLGDALEEEEDFFADEPVTEDSIVEDEPSLLVLDLSQPAPPTTLDAVVEELQPFEDDTLPEKEIPSADGISGLLEEDLTSEEAEFSTPVISDVAPKKVIISLEPEEFSEQNVTNPASVFQPEESPAAFAAFKVDTSVEGIQDSAPTVPILEPFVAVSEDPEFPEEPVFTEKQANSENTADFAVHEEFQEEDISEENNVFKEQDISEEQDDNFFAQFDPSELQQLEEDSKANLAQYVDLSNDNTDRLQAEDPSVSFVDNSEEDSFSEEDKPKWEGIKGITADPSRESELGPGKWTEEARSIEELTKDMPTTPVREMELYEEGAGYGWIWWLLGLGCFAGLFWLLWNSLG